MLDSEERVENEVRRRLAAALRSNGWGDEGVAKEVLYWLPPRFVEWYREAYTRSVNVTGALAAKSGAGQRTTGDEAEIRAVVNGKYKGKRVGAGVGGQGKRYVEGARVVRDEEAMARVGRVNRFLERMADSDGRLVDEKVGRIVRKQVGGVGNGGRRTRRVCDECGKFMKDEWVRCPFHEV